ncbi:MULTISPECIES: octaprenyl diphosphate synthase [Idiomarina]|uniref:octaprenyl diphosphate synthase n=1 Tax=Idiomarina TaxID=135575 RepID=UPI00129CF246|nr:MULTISPECIES: octaprenyl diphosphate synthase [Idiomarina]MRJ41928.1 octaprenyl diphosphate synthase [Idiomarina sp. FeN1]NCU57211.1 octaprenyl diphosphate synthase [Idiomarina sp. FenA--70]NCU59920.1 octaprenyl diphosphate synthase [Idiomarina sp. FenBw--71]UUN12836.1 octaprenyl diphosphate synthase [Idiomarina loihiensis]
MNLKQINALMAEDMAGVNQLIGSELQSDVALINQLGLYIVNSGGKRLRPLLAVTAARAVGYQGHGHLTLATIVEFIHTATLLHDDVVDASELRRGEKTANAVFGNEASVLVGDFLYTRAFQLMVTLNSMKVMKILADATNIISEGEVLQLMNCNDPDTTETSYFEVIYGKTGKLFEAATQLGAVLAAQPEPVEAALAAYGRHLGTAFQLVDDLLDYTADSDTMGKQAGDDLAEGKPTLPLLYAMWHGNDSEANLIRQAIEQGNGRQHLAAVLTAMQRTGALEYTRNRALAEAELAQQQLQQLPPSPYRDALHALAAIAVDRIA